MKILVADDDRDLLQLLQFSLVQAGYEVVAAFDGATALASFARESPEFAILDINMPGANGFEVCEHIRRRSGIPILMLTARGAEEDLVQAFDSGADEYVTKPFSPRILLARVRALLRRTPSKVVDSLDVGDIHLDSSSREIHIGDAKPVNLTQLEVKLMHALLSSSGRTLSPEKLLLQVWGRGSEGEGEQRALKQMIYRLRRKMREVNVPESLLQTVPGGAGYRVRPESKP